MLSLFRPQKLVLSCNHGYVTVIDLDKEKSRSRLLPPPNQQITACAATADNKIVTALRSIKGSGISMCIWQDNLKDYTEVIADKTTKTPITAVTCSLRGTYIAAAFANLVKPNAITIMLLKNQGGEIKNTDISELEKLSAARTEKSGCVIQ